MKFSKPELEHLSFLIHTIKKSHINITNLPQSNRFNCLDSGLPLG